MRDAWNAERVRLHGLRRNCPVYHCPAVNAAKNRRATAAGNAELAARNPADRSPDFVEIAEGMEAMITSNSFSGPAKDTRAFFLENKLF